jgi:predicted phage terminase large subunit-like protein
MIPSSSIAPKRIELRPQPGPQEAFLTNEADILIYGGAAGGGKTWALLFDMMRYAAINPVAGFGAVIFRRTSPQVLQQGGLWDESSALYPLVGGKPNLNRLEWSWPQHKTRIRFSHLQYESDMFNWQGSQIARLGFDELTHYPESVFWYLLSRNRSTCGVKPQVRATTNPDADSWVKTFLAPWVDETFPLPAKSGEVRRFVRDAGQIVWLPPGTQHADSKSVSFIAASIFDNPALLKANPDYLANLKALPLVERQRLLYGDWSIRPSGNLFKRHWFEIIDTPPAQFERTVRYWDLAGTAVNGSNDPDWTAGVKVGLLDGRYYVLDIQHVRETPHTVEQLVKQTAQLDGRQCHIYMEQEPGSAGKKVIDDYRTALAGYIFNGVRVTGDKVLRAQSTSSQAEGGNVKLVRAYWNEVFLNELAAFPMVGIHDDMVDAVSGGVETLIMMSGDALAWVNEMAALVGHDTQHHATQHSQDYPTNER